MSNNAPILTVGMDFSTMEAARGAITKHIVSRAQSFRVEKAGSTIWVLRCRSATPKNSGCQFRIRVAETKAGLVKLKKYIEHSCSPDTHQGWRGAHSVKHLALKHFDLVAEDRKLKPKTIASIERHMAGNPISYMQAYRTKKAIKKQLDDRKKES